jgi:uncharacterized membrane protein YgdD (TMEM256/DUF423 family)
MLPRRVLLLAGLLGALAVLLGAFAAHGLRAHLAADRLDVFETGVRYHMYHALALGLCGLLGRTGARLRFAPWCFLAGIALFCGSLYALALDAGRWLGAVTPFGGIALVAGWLALGFEARRGGT